MSKFFALPGDPSRHVSNLQISLLMDGHRARVSVRYSFFHFFDGLLQNIPFVWPRRRSPARVAEVEVDAARLPQTASILADHQAAEHRRSMIQQPEDHPRQRKVCILIEKIKLIDIIPHSFLEAVGNPHKPNLATHLRQTFTRNSL